MPVISTLGAASSRGFGEFLQTSTSAKYIENYFASAPYIGTGTTDTFINTNVGLENTSSWQTTGFYRNGTAQVTSTFVDSSNNLYVSGYYTDTSTYGFLAKYNSLGVLQWQRSLLRTQTICYGITADSSGNVYVTGNNTVSSTRYLFVAKYNSSGVIQWQKEASVSSNGNSITVDSSGNIYIGGTYVDSGSGINRLAFFKLDSNGNHSLARTLAYNDAAPFEYIGAIKVDSSGNIYIAGNGYDNNVATYYALVAKYNSSGTIQWQRQISGSFSNSNVAARGVDVDASGNVYVCGTYGYASSSFRVFVIKYNSAGTLQWNRALYKTGDTDNRGSWCKLNSSEDSLYVVGNILAAKYNSSGVIQWNIADTTNTSSFGGRSGALSASNLFIGGSTNRILGTSTSGCVVKLKPDTTISGEAFVRISSNLCTDATGAAASQTGTATSTSITPTYNSGTATDAAGQFLNATQIQQEVTGAGGLVWLKVRSTDTYGHYLYDTVRGANQYLSTDASGSSTSLASSLTSFNAGGFVVGSAAEVNASSSSAYSSWTFRETQKFFDIVQYTGTGSVQTISHNLGSAPGMMIIKNTSSAANWAVYHRSLTNSEFLYFNFTNAVDSASTIWNNTAPTASNFTVGSFGAVNTNGKTYIAYLFAHDAGGFGLAGTDSVINCGSYTGNGSATGPSVSLGWEPQFVLIKSASTGSWIIADSLRGVANNIEARYLTANAASAETGSNFLNFNSTGFSIFGASSNWNSNATKYIYMAIRRGPMEVPTYANNVFNLLSYTENDATYRGINIGFPTDMIMTRPYEISGSSFYGMLFADRKRGNYFMGSAATNAETENLTALCPEFMTSTLGNTFSSITGYGVSNSTTFDLNSSGANKVITYGWRRAPSVMDVVSYTGTGANNTISHNLTTAPQLMLIKARSESGNWFVYSETAGNTKVITGLGSNTPQTDTTYWNSTSPTATTFTVGTNGNVNSSGINYIAYLFGSCAGVSKVGSYTGTGSTLQVDCGFSAGARFVLIKRIDVLGNFHLYDVVRGISTGDDPYLFLDTTAAQTTGTSYINPYAAGFELSSTAPAALNANGGTYIYLAVA